MSGPSPRYLPAFDGLRAIAALWVVASHGTTDFLGAPTPVIRHGYLGVDLFFVLSGFVLAHVYAARFAERRAGLWRVYLVHRFARLWPVWLVVLALFALKAEIGHALHLSTEAPRVGDEPATWLLHALLMQSWGFTDPERINPPGWSLSYEWAGSLLLPFVLVLVVRLRSAQLCLILIALCLNADALYTHALGLRGIAGHGGMRAACELLAGVLLWQATRPAPMAGVTADRAGWCCAAGLLLALLLAPPLLLFDHLLVVILVALVGLAGQARGSFAAALSWPPLRAIGTASYALYVVHYLVDECLWWGFEALGSPDDRAIRWAFVAGMIMLSLLAAFVLHYTVERPARRVMRRISRG